jgi:hypothetical protein
VPYNQYQENQYRENQYRENQYRENPYLENQYRDNQTRHLQVTAIYRDSWNPRMKALFFDPGPGDDRDTGIVRFVPWLSTTE